MRIALAQINPVIADFRGNLDKMKVALNQARANRAQLVVFPELAICGYPPLDFLEHPQFIDDCLHTVQQLSLETDENFAIIAGCPARNNNREGKRLYNAAFVLYRGSINQTVYKSLLPNYDVFDEHRYFEPGVEYKLVELFERRIALTICEDLWDEQDREFTPLNQDRLYTISPMEELMRLKPDLMINIAASPFSIVQQEKRESVLKRNALKHGMPLVYVNQCGAQTELVFDGLSSVYDEKGRLQVQMPEFSEGVEVWDDTQPGKSVSGANKGHTERTYDALICGIRDFFVKQGFKKAILGLSGGIDSAVTLALAAEALGAGQVLPVLLPSAFSSAHSITDAEQGAANLGCSWQKLEIEGIFREALHTLSPSFRETPFGLAEENLQARIRALLLMGISNKHGYILLNTSNKSEMAVGYGTLYGDMCGGLSVLGDVYKTQVYRLAEYINREKEVIPVSCITKAPSAELRPGQKDIDSLPDYPILDAILERLIEQKKTVSQIVLEGFEEQTVQKIYRLLHGSEHKRKQAPPVIRVTAKAFGLGRRMPVVAHY